MNAICWSRNLAGDFAEIMSKFHLQENITEVSIDDLMTLQLSESGHLARKIVLEDIQLLTDYGASLHSICSNAMNGIMSLILLLQMSIHFMSIAHRLKQILSYVPIMALQAISCPMIRWNKRF